jgi:probable O-glycosylation ligase (exosortase A-associated)
VKGGIFTVLSGGGYRVYGPPGLLGGNNEIAIGLLMTIPLANYLRMVATNVWVKRGLVAAMALMGLAAIGSQSRGAFLAAAAMLAFLWMKSRQKAATGILALLVVAGVLAFMPESWHTRMDTIQDYEEDASAMGRINAWMTALNVATANLAGAGFDGVTNPIMFERYSPNPANVLVAHSVYFQVLGDHGFPGLVIYLVFGFLAFAYARRAVRLSAGVASLAWVESLARMLQVSMVAFAVGGMFLNLAYLDYYFNLVILAILLRKFAEAERKALEASRDATPDSTKIGSVLGAPLSNGMLAKAAALPGQPRRLDQAPDTRAESAWRSP